MFSRGANAPDRISAYARARFLDALFSSHGRRWSREILSATSKRKIAEKLPGVRGEDRVENSLAKTMADARLEFSLCEIIKTARTLPDSTAHEMTFARGPSRD